MDISEVTVDGAVVGQVKKVKLWDKNSALEKAMKHLGLFEKDNSQDKGMKITIVSEDSGVL
jgi:phage terminase small subunit